MKGPEKLTGLRLMAEGMIQLSVGSLNSIIFYPIGKSYVGHYNKSKGLKKINKGIFYIMEGEKQWIEQDGIYKLNTGRGSAEIYHTPGSRMHILLVKNNQGGCFDGCCQNTDLESLKLKAENSLINRSL